MDHLAINSTTAVAAEARVNPAFPATAAVELYGQVVEFVSAYGNWVNLARILSFLWETKKYGRV